MKIQKSSQDYLESMLMMQQERGYIRSNDVGSIVYGEEAVAEGLMDRVGTLSDALNALYRQMEQ